MMVGDATTWSITSDYSRGNHTIFIIQSTGTNVKKITSLYFLGLKILLYKTVVFKFATMGHWYKTFCYRNLMPIYGNYCANMFYDTE
jgi:hypothetical protein